MSYPQSGDLIKGHRIVVAELGLVPYEGKVVRNPTLFDGLWNKQRRSYHLISRLTFVHESFARLGLSRLTLYRGISHLGPLVSPRNHTFVFNAVPQGTGVPYRQSVPVERVFMTYLETIQMNRQYREAEAVLFFDRGNLLF